MRRTSVRDVFVASIAGASIGYLLQSVLVSTGLRMLVPPLSFSVTLVVAAVIVVALAWPIRRALRSAQRRPINALAAGRIVVLAKASSVSGASCLGLAIGIGYFALTRSVLPGAATLVFMLVAVVSAALLLIAGLLAEWFCTLPPQDDDVETAHG